MIIRRFLFLGLLAFPVVSSAHHARAAQFDLTSIVEVEGEVTEVIWRNPHIAISLLVVDENGNTEEWNLQSISLSNLRQASIDPSFINVGDFVRIAGNPGRRAGSNQMYISNVLTSEGQEVILGGGNTPRWAGIEDTIRRSGRRRGPGDTSAPELGIFRVWSSAAGLIPNGLGQTPEVRENLTAAALQAVDAFVFERDNPLQNCAPKGMPSIMHQPYPSEFVQAGDNIEWHGEEFDTVRTIHMGPNSSAEAEGQPGSLLGYSVGRWEDDRTLVVTTTQMNWGYLDTEGLPMSIDAVAEERFVLSPQGDRLDYTLTVADPVYLQEPMTFTKHWVWYPEVTVEPYNCAQAADD